VEWWWCGCKTLPSSLLVHYESHNIFAVRDGRKPGKGRADSQSPCRETRNIPNVTAFWPDHTPTVGRGMSYFGNKQRLKWLQMNWANRLTSAIPKHLKRTQCKGEVVFVLNKATYHEHVRRRGGGGLASCILSLGTATDGDCLFYAADGAERARGTRWGGGSRESR
jgi:hypothetical protein